MSNIAVMEKAPTSTMNLTETETACGWDRKVSRRNLTELLDRCSAATNASYNVAFAYDAEEAAIFINREIEDIINFWTGTAEELALVTAFLQRNLP